MPLLVVLLPPAHADLVEDSAGEPRLARGVRHRDIRHAFPGLIRNTRDELEDPELFERSRLAEDEIHDDEQRPGTNARPSSRRRKGCLLLLPQTRRVKPLDRTKWRSIAHRAEDWTGF